MTFEDLLRNWNGGIRKGAQLRLAKMLKVSEGAVSHWINAGRLPSSDLKQELAKILKITVEDLDKTFQETWEKRHATPFPLGVSEDRHDGYNAGKIGFLALLMKWNGGRIEGAPERFAKQMGVSEDAVSRWINTNITPDDTYQERMAAILGVDRGTLAAAFLHPKHQAAAVKGDNIEFVETPIEMVPVLGTISAERFNCSFETAIPDEFVPLIFVGIPGKKFALKVHGACMEPTAHDGDYAFIVKTENVADGKLAAVRLNGDCTLKRIFRHPEYIELRPDNPKFKPLKIKNGDFKIVGQVIFIGRKP